MTMSMSQSNITLFDLPTEILLIILQKLNNIDVLHSLFNVDTERLDPILRDPIFTKTLNFVLLIRVDDVSSIDDSILNRYCIDILPRIDFNITCLILESKTMERILLAAEYPHLSELKVYNVNDSIVSQYFTMESPFRCRFQKQILILTLAYIREQHSWSLNPNAEFVYEYILKLFTNLKHLSIDAPRSLEIKNISLDTCLSSNVTKLCLNIYRFQDCFALLDGRLKHLTMLTINLNYFEYPSSVVINLNELPNMKSFSLTCNCPTSEFDTYVTPLLRSMPNLQELCLKIRNEKRSSFIDGAELHEKILVHMSQLSKFTFYISTKIEVQHLVNNLSEKDIQRSFTNLGYEQVACFLHQMNDCVKCHVFSLPFTFDCLSSVGCSFPSMIFNSVTDILVYDDIPFTHEFFLKTTRCFPHLEHLLIINHKSSLSMSNELDTLDSVVEFPHLTSLDVSFCHRDYVEQFLNRKRTYLPCLTKLEVNYEKLRWITDDFTRETTRMNCARVKRLVVEEAMVYSEDVYAYFPLLNSK